MPTVKILTSKVHRASKGCIIGSSIVNFNDLCIAEVEAEEVDFLLEKDDSLSVVKLEKGGDLKKGKISKGDETLIEGMNEVIEDLTKENVSLSEKIEELNLEIKALKRGGDKEENPFLNTSLEDCRELCKNAGYPDLKWGRMKEKSIHEYLFEQYKAEQLVKTE